MKKLILHISILVVFLVFVSGQVFAQDESSNKITCDEVWKIVGTKDCPDWAVNNDLGGVWCNITSLERAPWTAGKAPKYTFTPGTCSVEEADQPQEKPETSQPPGQKEEKSSQETSKQEENPVIQIVSELMMETEVVPLIGALKFSDPSGVPEDLERFTSVTGKNLEETLNWKPIITKETEQAAWQFKPEYILPDKENITVVKGQGEMKSPASSEFIPITTPKGGDTLQVTYLDSTLRSTSEEMQIRYTWGADSGALSNVPKGSEIEFLKPVQDKKTQELMRILKLNQGDVEIKVKNADSKNKFGVQGDFFDLFVVQTHFWVSQSQDKKMAVVGIYEGEVEVKTKDGKTIRVAPKNGEPGVVVISQKLSPVKVAVLGVVLAVVVGGIVWFIKKKAAVKYSKKR